MHRHRRLIALAFVVGLQLGAGWAGHAAAQQNAPGPRDSLWIGLSPQETREAVTRRPVTPATSWIPPGARLHSVDRPALENTLRQAAPEDPRAIANWPADAIRLALPMPDGSSARFRIVRTSILPPELAKRFPGITTYRGQGVSERRRIVHLVLTPAGLHAKVLSPTGTVIVEPFGLADIHAIYRKRSTIRTPPWRCKLSSFDDEGPAAEGPDQWGETSSTYRLAVACTPEYTALYGGTVADAMAAIVTQVSHLSGIYERDLAIRFQLVADNQKLISTNTNDLFAGVPRVAGPLMNASQTVIDSVIGSAGYDLGHTVFVGAAALGEGIAITEGAFFPTMKAMGASGRPPVLTVPTAFWVDFVAHEMGHQLGASHTFAGSACGGLWSPSTAFEPGSGSTIMAYAGLCGTDNLAPHSGEYFHAANLDQIIYLVKGPLVAHPGLVPSGNHPPTVEAGAPFTIPRETPFRLVATGSDLDGDALTYCWEEIDKSPVQVGLSAPDDGSIPLFRSFPPDPSPARTFPQWPDILSNTSSAGEQLPSVGRTLRFRVTVRDNRSGCGGVDRDDTEITVHEPAGPFEVNTPTAADSCGLLPVSWQVAGTKLAPISTQFVNIRLSLDNGSTFPYLLAWHTPNDGSQLVALPSAFTFNGRILVEAVGNVFFAVSRPVKIVPHNLRVVMAVPPPPGGILPAIQLLQDYLAAVDLDRAYVQSVSSVPDLPPINPPVPIVDAPAAYDLVQRLRARPGTRTVLVVGRPEYLEAVLSELGVSLSPRRLPRAYELLSVVLTDGPPRLSLSSYATDV
jgi:hypothetical protein